MKHLTTKFIAALFGWILLGVIALAWTPASAQTITKGYTACGAEATGKDRTQGGKSVTAKLPRQFVGPDGYWHTCQPWVADGGDPRTPEPTPDKVCPARDTYEFWDVGGRTCSSVPPGEYSGGTVKLAETPAGRVRYITSNPEWTRMGKATWGYVMYRCVVRPDGSTAWQVEPDAVCRWANE